MNQKEIVDNLNEIQSMCNNVLILYNAHAKGNKELTDLANITYYILWNYTKSLIALKQFHNATLRCEQDFAIGELYITTNECVKHVIGFKTDNGKQRKESLWMKEMGNYILKHPIFKEKYITTKNMLIEFADCFKKNSDLKVIRDIAAHGDVKIEKLQKLHATPISNILQYMDGLGRCMTPVADFVFTCFESGCQQEMNK